MSAWRLAGLLCCFWSSAFAAEPATVEHFEKSIRPLLVEKCQACHGANAMGGLALTSRDALLKGGAHGPALVPGKPDESLLIQVVEHSHAKLRMPPQGKLDAPVLTALRDWVSAGAVWPEHRAPPPAISQAHKNYWAFQPVREPAPPRVRNQAWAKSPVDRFILARLEAEGLSPAPPADRRTLFRRVTFGLTGLPPTPSEMDAFLSDRSPDAFAKVVDRLLASPRYGERWGRFWLDVARYSDDQLNSTQDAPRPNAFRYRDWVIGAFNRDMPYDEFVKAQIAGDLLPDKEPYQAGLGFFALSPEFQDDRVDALSRGFLGLTVACAQCHDHKYDPIPTSDYYSLLGVFKSTKYHEIPLAPEAEVAAWDAHQKQIGDLETRLGDFLTRQNFQLGEMLAARTVQYLEAASADDWKAAAARLELDEATAERWSKYLANTSREHSYLPAADPAEFQRFVQAVFAEKKQIDDENFIRLGGSSERRTLSQADLLSLERDKYILWRDLFAPGRGLFYYGEKEIGRFLHGEWKRYFDSLRAERDALKASLPEKYPFLHAIQDVEKPEDIRIQIRGSADNLGDVAPRRFLAALCDGAPEPFKQGSGRLELAEAIASPDNPLTARVIVNRVWQQHFGYGLVRTSSNFGQLGERPTHPELLDFLAARLVANGWSLKALHREILLSAVYALSSETIAANETKDPGNRLLWRAHRRRLDVEALRDAMLAVAGTLDETMGGKAEPLNDDNRRRTVYGFVSRRKLDPLLGLFDFPSPNATSEKRLATNVPLQKLFFLNSGFVVKQAGALAGRLSGGDTVRIAEAYRLLYGRAPDKEELRLGREYLKSAGWSEYAQVLLSANEFLFLN
ncbi:MAG: PSD1 domain-containing protein [Bryobacterales bacterium]|nr:PSD1 domain-containing protein [Bryobacterales bacterium]